MIILNIFFLGLGLGCFGGLWNRLRGGGQESISYKPLQKLSHGVKRIILALLITISFYLPYYLLLRVDPLNSFIDLAWFMVTFLVSWIIGLLPGWGSWFFVGRAEDSWSHNPDAIWVEWISYLKYGAKWIPSNWATKISVDDYAALKKRFNLVDSPAGDVRPLHWRIEMEKFSMGIRGLGFSVPGPLVVSLHMFFVYDLNVFWMLPFIFPTGYAMSWCYDKINHLNRDRWPAWLQGNTQLGELLTGATVMTVLPYGVESILLIIKKLY